MNITLCSIPVEAHGDKLRRKRSGGTMPIMPKIAITSLNSWSIQNGFPKCKFYDLDMLYPTDDEDENYFINNPTDVLGLSAVVSTSYGQVKRVSKIIKKVNKKTIVVCGGYLTAAANTILNKTNVDICVVGDGEIAWIGILKYVKEYLSQNKNELEVDELLKIRGISILDKNKKLKFSGYGQKLQSCDMTFPDFEYLKSGLQGQEEALNNYFKPFYNNETMIMDDRAFEKGRRPMVASILLTKGCVAKCTFCQRGSKGYVTYNLDKLDQYLTILKEKYNVGFLTVDDENFGSVKKFCYEAAEMLNKHGMLWFIGGVRVTNVTKEDLLFYKKNGCISIKFGIESGSQTMLDVMEKKFTVEDIRKALYTCMDIGLYTSFQGFMLGMPGETLETCRKSGQFMGELAAKIRVPIDLMIGNQDLLYCIPLIGTPMYEYGKQIGIVGQSIDEEERFLELTSNIGAYKRYFINLNGAPMHEVVFWDMLVFLEATRIYYKLMKNKSVDKNMVNKFLNQLKAKGVNPQIKAKQKEVQIMGAGLLKKDLTINQYILTNFLRQNIVFNKFFTILPNILVDNFTRTLVYLEYIIQKYLFKDKHNLHKFSNKKVAKKIRLSKEELNPSNTTQKERSLRTIVAKRKMPYLATFSNQDKETAMLTGGP